MSKVAEGKFVVELKEKHFSEYWMKVFIRIILVSSNFENKLLINLEFRYTHTFI